MARSEPVIARAVSAVASQRAPVTALLMSLGYAVALFHRTAFQGIDRALQSEFGLTPAASADLAAVFFWTYFALMIPAGLWTDRFGARRVAIAGCLVSAAGSLLFSHAESIALLVVARCITAAGSTVAFIGLLRFVAIAFAARKATVAGRGILIGNLGAMASGAPLVLLLALLAWQHVWSVVALVSVLIALALWQLGPAEPVVQDRPAGASGALDELRLLLSSAWVYLGMAILAGLGGAFYAFSNLIGPRWLAAHGFVAIDSGWMVTLLIAGYGLGAAFWGWIGDVEHQRTRALLVASFGALLCWMVLASISAVSAFAVCLLFFVSGACCGAFALVYPLIVERHPACHAGGVVACVNCGIPLGAATMQMAAGRLPVEYGPALLIIITALSAVGALQLLRDRVRRESNQ